MIILLLLVELESGLLAGTRGSMRRRELRTNSIVIRLEI